MYLSDTATADAAGGDREDAARERRRRRRRGGVEGGGAAALQAELRRARRSGGRSRRESAAGVDRGAAARRTRTRPTSSRSRRKPPGSPGVADVRYDRQWIQRLMHAVGIVRAGGFALAALLVFAAALTVASVVRLALVAQTRRDSHHAARRRADRLHPRSVHRRRTDPGRHRRGRGARRPVDHIFRRQEPGRLRGWPAQSIRPRWSFCRLPTWPRCCVAGMAVGALGGFIAARSAREIAD